MSAVRELKRRPAKRPLPRTVSIVIDKGDYEGWQATAKADFPARLLADLQSGSIERIISVLDAIIIDHNFPNDHDEIAQSMADVDPYGGLMEAAAALFDAIAKVPNR